MCMYCSGPPDCERCKPRFLVCPNCGTKTSLFLPLCEHCKEQLSEEAKRDAREQWVLARQSAS